MADKPPQKRAHKAPAKKAAPSKATTRKKTAATPHMAKVLQLVKNELVEQPPARGRQQPSVKSLEGEARDDVIVAMLVAGFTYSQIGAQFDMTRNGAISAVRRIMAGRRADADSRRADARVILEERIEALWRLVWPHAQAGDPAAWATAEKLLTRFARTYGIEDTPIIQVNQYNTGPDQARLEQIMRIQDRMRIDAEDKAARLAAEDEARTIDGEVSSTG